MSAERAREPIAIVGIGCRFPKSDGPAGFLHTLREGVDAVTEVPRDRWDAAAYWDPDSDAPGKSIGRWGGFLDDVRGFDWSAFAISPREARQLDPQHRLLLEVAWEAFEDAGIPFEALAGSRTGVFVGIMWNDYYRAITRDPAAIDAYSATGNSIGLAPNRLSFFFGLKGPSIALEIGCAASLTAVHYACESIWSGDCAMAIAGGVNLILGPEAFISKSKAGILSPDGRCKTFDARANGIAPGEGAGIVVLKPLSRALADGDRIYASIRGTAINHNGRTNWIQAVDEPTQSALVREALARGGVRPEDVDYVELHGTGTRLGDPIEARALGAVFASSRERPLYVGSVKTNIGHAEAASGVAHLIKTALSLHRGELFPSLHFSTPNPDIALDALKLAVPTRTMPWPKRERRVAGVTSLSLGGANAHAVLEGPPPRPARARTSDRPYVLPISARTDKALRAQIRAWQQRLSDPGADDELVELCATAALRRTHHPRRFAAVGRSAAELARALGAAPTERIRTHAREQSRAPEGCVFVFSGQGSQRAAMGRALYAKNARFREVFDRCDAVVRSLTSFSLRDEDELVDTARAQPAIAALQIALAAVFAELGVEPALVIGHSVGEIAAAHVAGALSLEDAMRVAVVRGRAMQSAHGKGAMLHVDRAASELEPIVARSSGRIEIGAHNGPNATVLSGERAAIDALERVFAHEGVTFRRLAVEYAFHSAQMAEPAEQIARELRELSPTQTRIPLVSTLTGAPIDGPSLDGEYFARQTRERVRFVDALEQATARKLETFVELGAQPVLSPLILQALRQGGRVVPTLRAAADDESAIHGAAAVLWTARHPVRWEALVEAGACVSIPTYSWDREPLWIEEKAARREAPPPPSGHPLLGRHLRLAQLPGRHLFETTLDARGSGLLDHRAHGVAVFPASAYLEMAIAAARDVLGPGAHIVSDLEFTSALVLDAERPQRLQLDMVIDSSGSATFHVFSQAESEGESSAQWIMRASGRVRPDRGTLAR